MVGVGGMAAGCGDDDAVRTAPPPPVIVFAAENNRLNAYDPTDGGKQTVIRSRADAADGLDLNGQICFAPDGSRRFIAGEDTLQPDPPPAWGFFQLRGNRIGALSATQVGRLVPTYQGGLNQGEPYGCGFLRDGRLVTSDVGNQAAGPPNGQLIIWFPPLDASQPRYCKLDVSIGTAGGVLVDADDRIYVASARADPGIFRYIGPFPTSDDAAGGCGARDATGAPLADRVDQTKLIDESAVLPRPSAIVQTERGTFYVSSVLNGVIVEYDANGQPLRRVLQHPPGDNVAPYSTGTPFGLGIDSGGVLYYADLGLTIRSLQDIGPGPGLGTVRRIRFEDGQPLPPETLDSGLDFPDGIGVLEQ